ncbi:MULTISPECIES: sugar ABC transporter ATP-binding protein [Paenibacillus]|uniref:sugar ABC transporter ATP-binding protein n=1 Tax=Paenibacillus TaxID=44249 RepID=UPI001143E0B7|nr:MULTISPECIES: sugar ABC transporter ATP-binding protein [unclassified Paenibacillus]
MVEQEELALSLRGLCKSYSGIQVLHRINLDIRRGEIHCLAGQNGAGKSTIIRAVSGVERPDSGTIELEGRPVRFNNPHDSQREGIFTIYQELSLVPGLSIAENIFLSDLPRGAGGVLNWRTMRERAREALEWLGINIDVNQPVSSLTTAQQQGVELAKVLHVAKTLHGRPPIILLDEPTATLPAQDVKRLLQVLKSLQKQGVTFIYISHRMDEVFEICQRITVLRDGRKVGTYEVDQTTPADIVRAMIGRNLGGSLLGESLGGGEKPRYGLGGDPGHVALSVENLHDGSVLHDISFKLHRGEVLGVAGLVGSGQSELAACLFGARERISGKITINGRPTKLRSPSEAIRAGIGLLPQSRKTEGLVLNMSVTENVTMASLSDVSRYSVINRNREEQSARELGLSLNIKMRGPDQKVVNLSGGNQQKVVLAKWLASQTKILIFDEPTRGIDVGAKEEIYKLIGEFVREGGSVLLMSSELPETLMCDRILVIARGRIVGEFLHDEVDPHGDVVIAQCY